MSLPTTTVFPVVLVARQAKPADACTGCFQGGRYKNLALLDEVAVLACMADVDLHPTRANMAKTPDGSGFTSWYERIKDRGTKPTHSIIRKTKITSVSSTLNDLAPFAGRRAQNSPKTHCPISSWITFPSLTGSDGPTGKTYVGKPAIDPPFALHASLFWHRPAGFPLRCAVQCAFHKTSS